jgi:hypothetical protein
LLEIYNYFRWKSTIPKPLMELAILDASGIRTLQSR